MGLTTGWQYYQSNVIVPQNSTASNVQCLFTIHRTTGSSDGFHIYVGTDCKEDFSDIRFYDIETNTFFYHSIIDVIGNVSRIWVKIPTMEYGIPFTMIVLYGNPDAIDVSDPVNTFLYYEDFSSGILDPAYWSLSNINTSITDGVLTCSPLNPPYPGKLWSVQTYPDHTAIDVKARSSIVGEDTTRVVRIGFSTSDESEQHYLSYALFAYTPASTYGRGVNRSGSVTSSQYYPYLTANVYHIDSVERGIFGTDFIPNYDETTPVLVSGNFTTTDKKLLIYVYTANLSYPITLDIDHIQVRTLLTEDPEFETWTSQRDASTLVIYPDPATGTTGVVTSLYCSILDEITDVSINFGDGTTDTVSEPTRSFEISHTYLIPGTYTVTVSGYNVTNGKFILAERQIVITRPVMTADFSVSDGGQWEIWEEWVDYNNEMITLQTARSLRIVLQSDRIMAIPGKVKIKIAGPCKNGDVADAVLNITNAAIVRRNGSTSAGLTTPTPITFNGGSSSVTIGKYENITDNPMYYEVESDWLDFAFSEDTDYLVILDATIYKTGSTLAFVNCPITERNGHITYISDTASYNTLDMVSPSPIEGLICLTMVYGSRVSMLLDIVSYDLDAVMPNFSDYEMGPIGYTEVEVQLRVFRTNLYGMPNVWWGADITNDPNASVGGDTVAILEADPTATYCGEFATFEDYTANRPSNPTDRTWCIVNIPSKPIYRGSKIWSGAISSPLPAGYYGRSLRHVPIISQQNVSGNRIRLKLTGSTTDTIRIENAGIAKCSGVTMHDYRQPSDYHSPITRITFGGQNTIDIPPGESVFSDWITYTYDKDTAYTIVIDTTSSFSTYLRNVLYTDLLGVVGFPPNGSFYFRQPTYSMPLSGPGELWLNVDYGTRFCPDYHTFIEKIQTISSPDYFNIVQFTDVSTGNPNEWYWDFGDGNHSYKQNPIHIYRNTGTYTVTLTISNQESTTTYSTTITIFVVLTPPVPACNPNFINRIYPTLPESIQFTNVSNPLEFSLYRWDFGNGEISVDRNPSTSYDDYGMYTLKLLITNPLGTKVATYQDAFKFVQCEYHIINEMVKVSDTSHGFIFTIINEIINIADTVVHLSVCREIVRIFNGGDLRREGIDEYGIGNQKRTIDSYGRRIRSKLNEYGHRILRFATSRTNTDCTPIEQIAICEERVLVMTDAQVVEEN
jgi:PKD repeat protein